MTRLQHPDLVNHIGLDHGRLIADLDQSAHPNSGSDGVHGLFCMSISQHKRITREEGNGLHLHLTMADGLLFEQRTIDGHALPLEVCHCYYLMLRLGLYHPPGLIPGFF